MGKLLIFLKYVFYVYSSDVKENRRHVHVTDKKRDIERICKFWIEPKIELHENIRFSEKELNEIEKLVRTNIKTLNEQLDVFYTQKTVKSINKNE
ncbi:MAG: DUF4160 domain-containing protein [Bacteroidetes bacterium]|nr:MAG: DUF4160 domain-containing protein [Bacteroidota bacterium]